MHGERTDRRTDGHCDSMTDPAQRAESVKKCCGVKLSDQLRGVAQTNTHTTIATYKLNQPKGRWKFFTSLIFPFVIPILFRTAQHSFIANTTFSIIEGSQSNLENLVDHPWNLFLVIIYVHFLNNNTHSINLILCFHQFFSTIALIILKFIQSYLYLKY